MSENLQAWIGRREVVEDTITAWPVVALQATLDLDAPAPTDGDPLPPLWHWLFFLPASRQSELGPDGHPKRGVFLPPVPLPRRMIAGSRIEFLEPLRIGERARREGTVISVEEKHGKAGPLVFVTVRHEISTGGRLAVREEQDLVYREAATGPEAPVAGTDPIPEQSWTKTFIPDEVSLFRFSALTFNGHRIHYDHPYATGVEYHPHLIVHGPMTAILLANLAEVNDPRLFARFSFRARSPLFADGDPVTLGGGSADPTSIELSAWSHDRRLAMTATVSYPPSG